MGENGTFWLPESASTLAPTVDNLFYFVTWVSIVLFILVVVGMVWFAYKYRRQTPNDAPQLVEEKTWLEVTWVVVPTLLVLVVFNWGFRAYVELAVAPPDAYEIRVTGYQWYWQYEYDNGLQTSEDLYVPANRPVKLLMSSGDVLHSFFVPEFRVKHDVLPDRYTSVWFEATRPGEYNIFCTEYCGTSHSTMLGKVIALPQAEFDEWLNSNVLDEDTPLPEVGAYVAQTRGCLGCHAVEPGAPTAAGPSWVGLYGAQRPMTNGEVVEADENYLRESILQPGALIVEGYQNIMPANYTNLTERELNGLIEYIETLQ